MAQPIVYGEWTVKYSYVDAQLVETCAANVGGFANTENARLTFVPVASGPPPVAYPAGVWPNWRSFVEPGPHAAVVWHTVQWAHTPTTDDWTIDGVAIAGISPALQAAYNANEAAQPMTNMAFYVLGDKHLAFDNAAVVTFGPIKLGTAPGASDILLYDPAVDGLAPWVTVVGNVSISVDGLQCGPATGPGGILDNPNGVTFDVDVPWPPVPPPVPISTFQVSFSVGVTFPLWQVPTGAPPLDLGTVQGALPETLLQDGFQIELGVYDEFGAPLPSGNVKDATLAFGGLEALEDEP